MKGIWRIRSERTLKLVANVVLLLLGLLIYNFAVHNGECGYLRQLIL